MVHTSHVTSAEPVQVDRLGEVGPVVLFLSGLNTHGNLWRPWMEPLAAGKRVMAVTPAGFAGVEAAGLEHGFCERLVPALSRLLAAEEAQGATVVGHSLGGLIALMLARAEPKRVESVLVVDSLPYLAETFMPGAAPWQAAQQAGAVVQWMLDGNRRVQLLATLTSSPSFLTTLEAWSDASDQATSMTAFTETLSTDFRQELKDITQPITVLAAWHPSMGVSQAQRESLFMEQYAQAPNVRILVAENSRHFIMIDQPHAFDAALATVLDQ